MANSSASAKGSFWSKIWEFIKKILGSSPSSTTTTTTLTSQPPLTDPPNIKLKGYGMSNMWMTLNGFDSFMKTLKDNGCNCTSIELFGREEDGWINKQDTIKSQLGALIISARKYGIVVFVNIVNWGSESLISQSDTWFQGWLTFIKEFKSANLIVQACAEWSGDKAANWCKMAESTLTGFSLSWNEGSRPQTASSRYNYIDYHSTSLTDLGGSDKRTICNTDSQILNTMMNGGVLGQTFKVDQVTTFSTEALKQGKSVNLYGYYHQAPDVEAIKALGKIAIPSDPSQPSDPTVDPDGFVFNNMKWVTDISPFNTKVDPNAVITSAETDANYIYPVWGTSWVWEPNDGFCDSKVAIAYKRPDGTWWGGRVDWNPIVRRDKLSLEVAHNADSHHEFPDYGTPMRFFLYNEGAPLRTKEVVVKWRNRSWIRRLFSK